MKYLVILREKFRILCQVLRINLRTSIITLIGLSVALSMITSCLIFLETNRADYYLSLLDDDNSEERLDYTLDYYEYDLQGVTISNILAIQEALETQINDYNLQTVLIKIPLSPRFYCSLDMNYLNYSLANRFYGVNLTESMLTDCIGGSKLPTTPNETLLFIPGEIELTLGDFVNISIEYSFNPGSNEREYYSHSLRITGVITPDSLGDTSPLHRVLDGRTYDKDDIVLISEMEHFLLLFQTIDLDIKSITGEIENLLMPFYTFYSFIFNTSNIGYNNVVRIISNLVSYSQRTSGHFRINDVWLDNWGWDSNINEIKHSVEEYNSSFFFFFFFNIPIFILTLLLILFSLSLVNEHRKKTLVLYKMRGLSSKFLFITLLIEILTIAFIASLLSIGLGIPLSILMLATTGYMVFNFRAISVQVVFPAFFLELIVLISLFFAFLTCFGPMIRLVRLNISHLEQKATLSKKRKPQRIRIENLDLFLITQGFLGIFLLTIFFQLINRFDPELQVQLIDLFLPVIFVLLLISPISFFIGFIFTCNRFLPLVIHKLGNFFWKLDWNLLATATRNLSVNIKVVRRVTVLIACTLGFLMILASLPLSLLQYDIDNAYYTVGSDIKIDSSSYNATTIREFKTRLSVIDGLRITTLSRSFITIFQEENHENSYYCFLGIEKNYDQVAHWRNYYDDQRLSQLVQSLFASNASYPIIIDAHSAAEEKLNENNIYQPFEQISDSLLFHVTGISDYWPSFIWGKNDQIHYLITRRDLMENISVELSNNLQEYILGYILPGYNPDLIIDHLLAISQQVGIFEDFIRTSRSQVVSNTQDFKYQLFCIIINFNLISSLFIVMVVISLFTLMRISGHATELGLSRALGMKYKQIFSLMLMEPLFLFLLSSFSGTFVGFVSLVFIINLFSPQFVSAPPFFLNIDVPLMLFIYSSIFIVTIFMAIIASFMATKANISNILKVE